MTLSRSIHAALDTTFTQLPQDSRPLARITNTRETSVNLNIKIAASTACLLGTLAVSHHAVALPVTVDFTVTSTDHSSGDYYQPGVIGSGFFTFDDALMPAGGSGHIGNSISGVPTLDLSFDWFGVSFDETNAGIAVLEFGRLEYKEYRE